MREWTGLTRVYMVLNEHVASSLGCHRYWTALVSTDQRPRYAGIMRVMQNSDVAIECDEQGNSRYVKHRFKPCNEPVDPDELAWIKLSCIEALSENGRP